MTRPKAVAPPGYVTLQEAADMAGVSRTTAYRRIAKHNIAHILEKDALFIAEEHVELIDPRVKRDDPRVAVMVRVPKERYEVWERAARRYGAPVSTWLGELADSMSGYGKK